MKTMSLKIDDALVHAAMKRGGFKKPEDAITYGLNKIIESSRIKKESSPDDFKSTLSPQVRNLSRHAFNAEGKTDKELLHEALEEKHLR